MASRPFATINVALETDEEPPDLIGGNVKVSVTFRIVTSELALRGSAVTAYVNVRNELKTESLALFQNLVSCVAVCCLHKQLPSKTAT